MRNELTGGQEESESRQNYPAHTEKCATRRGSNSCEEPLFSIGAFDILFHKWDFLLAADRKNTRNLVFEDDGKIASFGTKLSVEPMMHAD